MNVIPTCYAIAWGDAEQILARHLVSLAGHGATTKGLHRQTLRKFLADLREPDEQGALQLVLGENRLVEWMIREVSGRNSVYARKRLAVLGCYSQALAEAGLVGADLMAEFHTRHGNRPLHVLVKALQAEDPKAALATLHPDPLSAGPLQAQVRSYLELQRSLGKKFRTHELVLNQLSRFLQAQGVPSPRDITPALVERWLDTLTCCPATRLEYVRLTERFFQFLQELEAVANNSVRPIRLAMGRSPRRPFRPFIFSHDQIAAILAKARRLSSPTHFPLRGLACYTMLVLLYSLGLRHGEALRLRVRDLDWGRQVMFISETKFHKSRLVPFGPKVGSCLQQFLKARHTVLQPLGEGDPLFVARWRVSFGHHVLLDVFRTFLQELKITGIEGQRAPRLHDLRHTFAVHRLLRWYREGVDVQSRLPTLATFMGHVEPLSTQVYLTTTAELLNEANIRFHRHAGYLFDEEVGR